MDAVIFDLDGTLIDSTSTYFRLVDIVLDEMGLPPVPQNAVLEALKDGDFQWSCIFPSDSSYVLDELITKARGIIDDVAPSLFGEEVGLIPGAAEILKNIAAWGSRIGLVTSTPRQNLALKMKPLEKAGLEDLLEVIITTDDAQNKKPHPEPLIKCSNMLGVVASKCVYVGDTRVDIRAGKAAGMKTIGVLSGFDDYSALMSEGPDAVIGSIAELFEVLDL